MVLTPQLRVGCRKTDIFSLIDIAVGGGEKICLIIEGFGSFLQKIPVSDLGGHGRDKNESQKTEDEISQKEFTVKRTGHRLTSNL